MTDVAPRENDEQAQNDALIDEMNTADKELEAYNNARAKEAKTRLKRIRKLRKQDTELFRELAMELNGIRQNDLFTFCENPDTKKPYQTMREFILEELDYSERRAHYMMRIGELGEEFGVEFLDKILEMGWVKVTILADVINPENADEWLEKANGMTVKALRAEYNRLLKAATGEGDDESKGGSGDNAEGLKSSQTKRVTLDLFDDQYDRLHEALRAAQKVKNSDKKGELLDIICLSYMSDVEDIDRPIEYFLKGIEDSLGVRLIALAPNNTFVYGSEYVDELAEGIEGDEEGDEG